MQSKNLCLYLTLEYNIRTEYGPLKAACFFFVDLDVTYYKCMNRRYRSMDVNLHCSHPKRFDLPSIMRTA